MERRPGHPPGTTGRRRAAALALLALGAGACEREATIPALAPVPATFADGTPRQRPEFEAIARATIEGGDTKFFPKPRIRALKETLSRGDLAPGKRLDAHMELARAYLEDADIDAAVAEVGGLDQLARNLPGRQPLLEYLRGLIHLRRAEVQNCLLRHNADCCILPLSGGGVHTQREPAESARNAFARMLQLQPEDLRGRWLSNLVAMALAEYPDGVPAELRLPPAAFDSKHDIRRFPDVAARVGLDTLNNAGGVMVEDFDGDGLLDVITSSLNFRQALTFKRNEGNGEFGDRSEESRLDDQLGGLNCVAADHDGDGDMDVLVLRGGWLHEDGRVRKSLLANDGRAVFADVTRAAGLADPPLPTQTAAWADYDADGDLDLYVGNESRVEIGVPEADYPCQLYRNEGDGRFTDVARAAGVTNDRYTKGVAAGDFDNDGWMDLYLSNVGPNRLYRNGGDLSFADVTARAGVVEPSGRSFATWFFDFDDDGWLDIYVGAYDATVADVCADYLGLPDKATRPCVYRNEGDGTFTDVARSMGLDRPILPMGANHGDLDNDGWLDVYLTTGDPNLDTLMPNLMFRNDGGKRFQDVTKSGGFGHLQKGHGVSFADLDNDGDQDVFHQIGGFYDSDTFRNALYLNPGHGNRFVTLVLRGAGKNTGGIGARVRVEVETARGPRTLHRAVGSASSFGGSPLSRLEIGLGDATAIERIEIVWPAPSSGPQVLEDVPLDSFVRVVEGKRGFERLALPVLEF